jgi:hypothetical protein
MFEPEAFAGYGSAVSMGKMAAVGKTHSKDPVSHFEDREINRHICGGAAEWLNIDVLSAKEAFSSGNCEVFYLISVYAASVKSLAGIAFDGLGVKD